MGPVVSNARGDLFAAKSNHPQTYMNASLELMVEAFRFRVAVVTELDDGEKQKIQKDAHAVI